MLGRANKAYEANPPQRNDLAKQLFPSSSPAAASQNGNIVDSFKKSSQPNRPGPAAAAAAASVSARNATFASTNSRASSVTSYIRQRSGPGSNSTSQNASMASLYTNAGSFTEDPDDLMIRGAQTKTAPPVFFNEDDFSDDENLDLDFAQPAALPPLPKPAAAVNTHPLREHQNPPAPSSAEQQIPWTSSPASHMLPPTSRTASSRTVSGRSLSNLSNKRTSGDDLDTKQPRPAKKRGGLPWAQEEPSQEEDDEPEISMWANGGVTPVPKKKDSLPWNATASAVKDKKRQLKTQTKKESDSPDLTMDEIRQITGGGIDVQSASKGINLSEEQQRVQELVVNHSQSVFFTGPAGTGKSVLMRSIIAELKKKFVRDPERLAVTASTGLAACNIGGITLHSFSGIGLGKEDVQTLVKKIRRNPKAKNRWLRTKILIVDEVSMVDGDLFDKLSQIGRTIRNNGRPWGGIQLVITGDFFQLPPVPDHSEQKRESKFAFDAATWNTSIDHTIGLTQVFRQKDPVFANMLNEMRLGRISDETVRAFKSLARPIVSEDGDLDLATTELFPTRAEVENSNQQRLRSLPGKIHRYDAHDTGDPAFRDKLLQNMMAPKSLELKIGAQVMLVKNMDDTLVNGSVGKVKAFRSEAGFEMQMGAPELDEQHDAKLKARIQAFSRQLEESKKGTAEYPVVEFAATDGSHRTILCVPEDWKVELPTGEVQASRSQVPLILAWALSIHKAQGQTLERVKVDLGKVFEKGQAYVALSRATSQQGLQVTRFEKHKVMAHPRVVQFYNKLYSVEEAEAKKTNSMASFLKTPGAAAVAATRAVPAPPKVNNGPMPLPKAFSRMNSMAAKQQQQQKPQKKVEVVDLDDEEEEAMASAHGW